MRQCLLAITALLTLLSGCARIVQPPASPALFDNPLTAKRYEDELVESMVKLSLGNSPILADETRRAGVEKVRTEALQRAKIAEKRALDGAQGWFLSIEEDVRGLALLRGNTLFLSPEFEATPGPSLHIFLTAAVDPRDTDFPDPEAEDLGLLWSPYGAQQYTVKNKEKTPPYRTVVLWDTALSRLHGFAQLSK